MSTPPLAARRTHSFTAGKNKEESSLLRGKRFPHLLEGRKKTKRHGFFSSATVTLMKTDGFANWSRVSTSSWVFENFFGFHIPVAAIFDRDYRCDDEIEEFLRDVNTKDTQCRILPFKEIENLLLVPSAVCAVVRRHSTRTLPDDWDQEILAIFKSCFEKMRSKTLSARIGSRIAYEVGKGSKKDIATISATEEDAFTKAWPNDDFKRKVLPGKIVFSEVAGMVQEKFAVTLTPARVIDELGIEDIPPEIFEILQDIQAHLGE